MNIAEIEAALEEVRAFQDGVAIQYPEEIYDNAEAWLRHLLNRVKELERKPPSIAHTPTGRDADTASGLSGYPRFYESDDEVTELRAEIERLKTEIEGLKVRLEAAHDAVEW